MKDHRYKINEFAKKNHENSVLHDDIDERDKQEAELKKRNKELNENLNKFEVIISLHYVITKVQNIVANASTVGKEFTDPRVARLWEHALKTGMDDIELDKLLEELMHFQRKLDKIKWMQEEHKVDVDDIPEHRTGGMKQKVCVKHIQAFIMMQFQQKDESNAKSKLKEQIAKVDKYERYIAEKIGIKHTEL